MAHKLTNVFDKYLMSSKIAIAVSGGLDSMVLMNLAKLSNKINTKNIHIVVVDHGLRKDSKEEALFVKEEAKKIGLRSQILIWKGKNQLQKFKKPLERRDMI